MTARYAARTAVPVSQSRAEIEGLLEKYGADRFAYSSEPGFAQIGFRIRGLMVRLDCPLPSKDERRFALTPSGKVAAESVKLAAWEQACRSRWRALALVVKAKLEACDAGISTLEREFLADTLLPNGETVGVVMLPQIELAYQSGKMPALLSAGGES